MSDLATPVRSLIGEVDIKFTRWDIYRTALGEWHFKGEQSTQVCELSADGFVEALEQALQWRALPLVPRPKELMYHYGFCVVKHGAKWRVKYMEKDCCVQFNAKRDAESWIERQVALSKSAFDSWECMYGWSYGKTEGVDFRYAR